MLRILAASTFAILLFAGPGAFAQSGEDFFKGKTITYIVSTNPGGGYDTYGRLVARYMEKYLPVDKIIVKNLPGAGHIIGANTIYAAKPDGLTFGTFNTGLIYTQILGREGVKFDLRQMSWIGKAASDTRVIMLGTNSGFATFEEFQASPTPVKMGVSGVGSAAYNEMALMKEALDLNVEMIPGYEGREDEMAILRGEVVGTLGSRSSFEGFVANKQGFYALEIGGVPGSTVPQARAYAKDDKAKAIVALIESQGSLARFTAGPPGIPEDRLKLLRDAYRQALGDPDLLAEAKKLDIPIDPGIGETVAAQVNEALNQSPETVAIVSAVMNIEVPTVTVKTELLDVQDEGKKIVFMSGSEQIESAVSGSRSKVTIGGKDDKRKNLKAGMECTIEFQPGGENEPKSVDCAAGS